MTHLQCFEDFINEEWGEFDDTPLYHITDRLYEILRDDKLVIGRPIMGPKGICVSRSREYSHNLGQRGKTPRIILSRELLKRDGYKSYPLDEWALKKIGSEKPWYSPVTLKQHHFGKSQFPHIKSGTRTISHNVTGIIDKSRMGTEVEFEERILKNIENLGKYVMALNFEDESEYKKYKKQVDSFISKYPHIKIYLGYIDFIELPTGFHIIETDAIKNIKIEDGFLNCDGVDIKIPDGDWEIHRIDLPKRNWQKTKVILKNHRILVNHQV